MSETHLKERHAEHPALEAAALQRAARDQGVADGLVEKIEDFAREKPLTFGLYALGIGFVLGWKLKPW